MATTDSVNTLATASEGHLFTPSQWCHTQYDSQKASLYGQPRYLIGTPISYSDPPLNCYDSTPFPTRATFIYHTSNPTGLINTHISSDGHLMYSGPSVATPGVTAAHPTALDVRYTAVSETPQEYPPHILVAPPSLGNMNSSLNPMGQAQAPRTNFAQCLSVPPPGPHSAIPVIVQQPLLTPMPLETYGTSTVDISPVHDPSAEQPLNQYSLQPLQTSEYLAPTDTFGYAPAIGNTTGFERICRSLNASPASETSSMITPGFRSSNNLPELCRTRRKGKLSREDKRNIIRLQKSNSSLRQEDIASMYGVNRSTISKTCSNAERWTRDDDVGPSRKQVKSPKGRFPAIEAALNQWYDEQVFHGADIMDSTAMAKAREIARGFGVLAERFKASAKWLNKFKKRRELGVLTSSSIVSAKPFHASPAYGLQSTIPRPELFHGSPTVTDGVPGWFHYDVYPSPMILDDTVEHQTHVPTMETGMPFDQPSNQWTSSARVD